MAYLKRLLNPRRQIKFVYITNTYKALLVNIRSTHYSILFGMVGCSEAPTHPTLTYGHKKYLDAYLDKERA